jgi:hypothetical protein
VLRIEIAGQLNRRAVGIERMAGGQFITASSETLHASQCTEKQDAIAYPRDAGLEFTPNHLFIHFQ